MAASEEDIVYCSCKQAYDEARFMIECDVCKDWFHGSCVGIKENQSSEIDKYHCPECALEHGPLKLKRKRSKKVHTDYEDLDKASRSLNKVTFLRYIEQRNKRKFASTEDCAVKLKGYELDLEYIRMNGFTHPILIVDKSGLDLKVPPPSFTVSDVERYVGSMFELDVIDVERQGDIKMLMREFVEYYNSPHKQKILNVISLEFSNTKLSDLITPPRILSELSWVSNYWPESTGDTRTFIKPEVQKYCLMSVASSYTDFHVDFGGTSVWYHILRGQKIFYLIEPSDTNLALYEVWASSSQQYDIFFADQVSKCYKVVVNVGETLFIPTGWIHGVFTPSDSLVFGGNFLHDYNIKTQLTVYGIERRIKTEERFLFPNFETLCWYAAKNHLEQIKECLDVGDDLNHIVLDGLSHLVEALTNWIKDADPVSARRHRDYLPEGISASKLVKELAKLIHSMKNETDSQALRLSPKKKKPPSKAVAKKKGKGRPKTKPVELKPDPISVAAAEMSERTAMLSMKFKLDKSGIQISQPEPPRPPPVPDSEESDVEVDDPVVKSPEPLPILKYRFSLGGRDIKDLTTTSSEELINTSYAMLSPERTQAQSSQPLGQSSPVKSPNDYMNSSEDRQVAWSRGLANFNKHTAQTHRVSHLVTDTKLRLGTKLESPSASGLVIAERRESSGGTRLSSDSEAGSDHETEMFNKYYKDDTYVYPALEESDDEFASQPIPRKAKRKAVGGDELWAPKSSHAGPSLPRQQRPVREKARRESVQAELRMSREYLEEVKKEEDRKSEQARLSKRKYTKKKPSSSAPPRPETPPTPPPASRLDHDYIFSSTQPSTSHQAELSAGPRIARPLAPDEVKRLGTKKPGNTPKQRLGKLLKIHKMGVYG